MFCSFFSVLKQYNIEPFSIYYELLILKYLLYLCSHTVYKLYFIGLPLNIYQGICDHWISIYFVEPTPNPHNPVSIQLFQN